MADGTRFCRYERESFPAAEFVSDPVNGWVHDVAPRHSIAGDVLDDGLANLTSPRRVEVPPPSWTLPYQGPDVVEPLPPPFDDRLPPLPAGPPPGWDEKFTALGPDEIVEIVARSIEEDHDDEPAGDDPGHTEPTGPTEHTGR